MKTYSANLSDASSLSNLVVPSGTQLPVDPKDGSLFFLTEDYPIPFSGDLPWYSTGLYRAQDNQWIRIMDQQRRDGWGIIGAQTVEVVEGEDPKKEPSLDDGYEVSLAMVRPVHRRVMMSGTASLWLESSVDCNVWVTVFRETEPFIFDHEPLPEGAEEGTEPVPIMRNYVLTGLIGAKLDALKATPISLTFFDAPFSGDPVFYVMKVHVDRPTFLSINECSAFRFDGASRTALIVSQNI